MSRIRRCLRISGWKSTRCIVSIRILTIVGARPQFIKSAPVSRAFKNIGIQEFVVHTGQHYDPEMSAVFFEELDLPKPYAILECGGLQRDAMIDKIVADLRPIIAEIAPQYVLVFGDTNSTLAGALAAEKQGVPIIHVEAGLRSFNDEMPEEWNRIQTDEFSHILFTPSSAADQNIEDEGFLSPHQRVVNVGDTMFDAVQMFSPFARHRKAMGELEWFQKPFALATLHRMENVKHPERLKERISTLNELHRHGIPVWMPLHPSTRNEVEKAGVEIAFNTSPPVGYLEMLWAIQQCAIVITDSGGLQKEAYFLGKHCITLRNETEWVELVDIGANALYPLGSTEPLSHKVSSMLNQPLPEETPYGSGDAALQIAQFLLEHGS
ncbi:MAG: UDP-N-acetylglucosamine 2-epimerase (non-hydrolyzing) [Flavobacteriia bacterium]|nr:UDP-N-acetylglucosamine 2-epimerase (non-hydrolyzing) [Flavobacteriia bacterium]